MSSFIAMIDNKNAWLATDNYVQLHPKGIKPHLLQGISLARLSNYPSSKQFFQSPGHYN